MTENELNKNTIKYLPSVSDMEPFLIGSNSTQLEILRQQVATLTQQSIEQALLVESLKTFLHDLPCTLENCGSIYSNYMCSTCAFLADIDTPPTIGAKALELVRLSKKIGLKMGCEQDSGECGKCLCCQYNQAAAAFTESEIRMIGG